MFCRGGFDYRHLSAYQNDATCRLHVVFPFFPYAIGAMATIRVWWTLNDTPDNADFPSNVTWAHVRRYLNDNCFGVRDKPGTTHIHVRIFSRAI